MNTPWLAHYDEGVPRSIGRYPSKSLVDFVREHAAHPDRAAIVFKGHSLSFRTIDQESDALARALSEDGLMPGERVGLVLPNVPQFIIAELAVWKAGGIIAPCNPIYTERELAEALDTTRPRFVIALTPFYRQVKNCQPFTTVEKVIATNVKEYLPPLLRFLFTVAKEKKEGHRITLEKGDAWLQDRIERGRQLAPLSHRVEPHDAAVILMTGGTTGTPKGAVSDHQSLVMAGSQLGAWLHEVVDAPEASVMLPLPLFHTYGCAGAQSLTITRGIPLVLIPNPRDLNDVVASIERDRPKLFCGVPTLFTALLGHREVLSGKVDFRSIRACFSGAAALMAETKKRFEELTGGRIVEGYSLTEATMACCANPLRGANKIGSVGMPLPDVQIRVVDSEDGTTELPAGRVGEILLHAPQLMRRYWNNAAESKEVIRDGWLYTGDLGYLDDDGYVFLVDRKKDVIKTSGFQVWPREVEEVIAAHPAVAEVGVAGVPDPRRGEVITAWVVPRPGQELQLDHLRAWCRERLAPYKVPARIEIRSELPKTMVGKVLRRVLVAQETAHYER